MITMQKNHFRLNDKISRQARDAHSCSKQRWIVLFLFYFIAQCEISWAACSCEECGRSYFGIREEYLYLQPLFDNTFIPNPNVNGPSPFVTAVPGSREEILFDYESGYRFSAFYFNSDKENFLQEVGASFTYLPAHHSRRFNRHSSLLNESSGSTDTEEINPLSLVHFIEAEHELNYYAGDLYFNHFVADLCHFSFSAQFGLHYAWMDYHNRVHFSAENTAILRQATLKEKSHTWGIGPQLGFDLSYTFKRRLKVKAFFKGGLLVSRSKVNLRETAESSLPFSTIHEKNGPLWRVLPFWEGNASLSYSYSISSYELEFEVGYEYLSYPDFIRRIQMDNNNVADIVGDIYSNIAFQGPYVALTFGF